MAPFYLSTADTGMGKKIVMRVLSANVHSENKVSEVLLRRCEQEVPDVVVLQESTEEWHNTFSSCNKWQFSQFISQIGMHGISVFSRWPVLEPATHSLGDNIRAAFIGKIQKEKDPFLLVAFDTLPPLSEVARYHNRLLSRRIATIVRHESNPVIILTDFNATPYSGSYQSFLDGARVQDAMYGQGYLGTWNSQVPFLKFPIDYVWYRAPWRVQRFDRVKNFGSDHVGLVVDFALTDRLRGASDFAKAAAPPPPPTAELN